MSASPYTTQQAIFYQQYESIRRDEVVGILLALFLGSFGAHHFYLGRNGLGILYLCFFWTGIPGFLGFVECFFMPGRVRAYNAAQAYGLAAALGIGVPAYGVGWGMPVTVSGNMPQPASSPEGAVVAGYPHPGSLIACPRCQQANVAQARFCSACGAPLT